MHKTVRLRKEGERGNNLILYYTLYLPLERSGVKGWKNTSRRLKVKDRNKKIEKDRSIQKTFFYFFDQNLQSRELLCIIDTTMGYNKMKFKLGLDTIELSVSPLFTIEELREKAKGLRSLTYRVAQGTDMPLEDIFEYCDLKGITVRGSNSKYYPMLKSGDVIHECPYDEYLEALIRGFTIHSMINKMREDRQGLDLWLIDGAEGKVPEGTKPEELLPSPEFLNGYDIVCFSSNNVYNLTGHALFNWEGANLKPGTKVLVISTMEDLWTKGISRNNRLPCFHRIMTPACVDQDKPTAFEELLDSYWNDDSKNRRRMGAWIYRGKKIDAEADTETHTWSTSHDEEAFVLYHGFVRGVE